MRRESTLYATGLALFVACGFCLPAACSDTEVDADVGTVEDTSQEIDRYQIDPTALAADKIILAFKVSGGMMWEPESVLQEIHHGGAVYLFGDGTVWDQTGPWGNEIGFRQWKKGVLPQEVWAGVLAKAEKVRSDDAGHYEVCFAFDAGSEFLNVDLPGLSFRASAFYAFEQLDAECEPQNPAEMLPRQELVDLVRAVRSLGQHATEPMITNDIILGWYAVESPYNQGRCEEAKTLYWPFEEIPLEPNEYLEIAAKRLSGQQATDVRTFLQQQWQLLENPGSSQVCVKQQEKAFVVVYDDALPEDTTYPFFDGDLSDLTL